MAKALQLATDIIFPYIDTIISDLDQSILHRIRREGFTKLSESIIDIVSLMVDNDVY
jgi:hypothetical protein